MSISNLFYPNNYQTYSGSLNTNTLLATEFTANVLNVTNIETAEFTMPTMQIWGAVNSGFLQTLKNGYNGFQNIFYDSTTSNFTTTGPVNKISLRIDGNDQLDIGALSIKEPRGNNGTEYTQPVMMKLDGADELCLFVVKKISSTIVELYYRRINNSNFVNSAGDNDVGPFCIQYPVAE